MVQKGDGLMKNDNRMCMSFEKDGNEKHRNMRGIIKYFKSNKNMFLIIIFAAILTYGYEITNWTISLDEELFSYIERQRSVKLWIGDGRWGIALLKAILPSYKVMPFWNAALSIVVLVIVTGMLCYTLQIEIKSKYAGLCAAIIFITMPAHSFWLAFDTYTLEISIGYLAAILSGYFYIVWLEADHHIKNILYSFLCLTFSIAVYQLFIAVYICLVCAGLIIYTFKISQREDNFLKQIFNYIFQSIINLIISLLIYGIINAILQHFIYKREYVNGFLDGEVKVLGRSFNRLFVG